MFHNSFDNFANEVKVKNVDLIKKKKKIIGSRNTKLERQNEEKNFVTPVQHVGIAGTSRIPRQSESDFLNLQR
jgi:hypothetical protein